MGRARLATRLAAATMVAIVAAFGLACTAPAPTPAPAPTTAPAKPAAAPTTAPAAAPTTAPATAPTAAPAAAAPTSAAAPAAAANAAPIKVASILSLTGPNSLVGLAFKTGEEMAVEDINKAGGVMGRKIELIIKDDGGAPDKSIALTKEALYVDKIDVFLSFSSSGTHTAANSLMKDEKKAAVTASMAAGTITTDQSTYPYSFSVTAPSSIQYQRIAQYVTKKLNGTGTDKLAIFSSDDAVGRSYADAYNAALKGVGVTPIKTLSFAPTDLDLTGGLKSLQAAGAQAILFGAFGPPVDRLIANLTDMQWDVPVLGGGGLIPSDWNALAKFKASANAYGVFYTISALGPDKKVPAKVADFASRVLARSGGKYAGDMATTMMVYDSLYVLKWGVEKAGTTDGPTLTKALETMKDWQGPNWGPYTFGPDRHYSTGLESLTMVKMAPLYEGFFREKAPNSD